MKIGIISDIHGYKEPLQLVMEAMLPQLDSRHFMINLGDTFSGGNQEEDVVAILRDRGVLNVRGNHDRLEKGMPPAICEFLGLFEQSYEFIEDGKSWYFGHSNPLMTHGSRDAFFGRGLWREDHGIKTVDQAAQVFEEVEFDRMAVGHVHFPKVFEFKPDGGISESVSITCLDPDSRYIFIPGAVGEPHALSQHIRPQPTFDAHYLIIDTESGAVVQGAIPLVRDGRPVFTIPEPSRSGYRW